MPAPDVERDLLINASRVPNVGGLHTFTVTALHCLVARYPNASVLAQPDVELPAGMTRCSAPSFIAFTGTSSAPRAIGGMLYSALQSWRYRKARVLSATHHALPWLKRQVLTIHDVRPRVMPAGWSQVLYFNYMLPRILRRVEGVITVSQMSKLAIASTYGVALEKIHVVPNAVRLVAPEAIPPRRDEPPYLLMVNAGYRHKNAIEFLQHHTLWRATYRLKILAGQGKYRDELVAAVERLGLKAEVEFLPHVSDEELAGLYKHAQALVYPSLLEGFGLPPAEAMAYGTPVIVSDIPVFREILGDAPLFVRLGDKASWKRAFDGLETARQPKQVEYARLVALQYTEDRMCTALRNALSAIWG